jgi:pyruvate dehydrogenase E2 component (dihydrolipoamide acetyltransferase)
VVVWGREDRVLPAGNAGAVSERADVRIVDGAGHMAHMEKPNAVKEAVEAATARG